MKSNTHFHKALYDGERKDREREIEVLHRNDRKYNFE